MVNGTLKNGTFKASVLPVSDTNRMKTKSGDSARRAIVVVLCIRPGSRGMAIIMVLIATFLVVEVLVLALHITKDNDNLSVFDVSIFARPFN